MNNNKVLYMMVGLPGSGKSTISKTLFPRAVRLSTDDYIEDVAKQLGMTYNQSFDDLIEHATQHLQSNIQTVKRTDYGLTVVWDQTNLTAESRRRKLIQFTADWTKIAVYVPANDEDLYRVNENRKHYGRAIPDHILKSMINCFAAPTEQEGFDYIITVSANKTKDL